MTTAKVYVFAAIFEKKLVGEPSLKDFLQILWR